MAIHALASMSSLTALCGTQASGRPIWLQVIQAAGGIATTVGVLIALYIALIREPKEASAEHSHHVAQMDIIRRARSERIGAQARKLVPSCARTPLLGELWWMVRIDNASSAVTTILSVDVTAIDARGVEVLRRLSTGHQHHAPRQGLRRVHTSGTLNLGVRTGKT